MTVKQENRSEPPQLGGSEWLKGADGTDNFVRLWQSQMPQALILYLHGIEGHSLWFEDTARFLAANGISSIALDRRGSGNSKEARGDMKDWRQLLDDVRTALNFAKEKAGERPLFLMANCWGAKLAAILAQEDKAESKLIKGLILSSPAIEVKVDLKPMQKLAVAWNLLTQNLNPLPIPLSIEDFTDNPKYLEFISNDSKRLSEATARFFFNTFLLTQMSKRCAEKICMPTIIMQSGIDTIVDEQGIKRWFESLSSKDKTFLLYPGVHHSLDFDKNPDSYREALLNWILERSKTELKTP